MGPWSRHPLFQNRPIVVVGFAPTPMRYRQFCLLPRIESADHVDNVVARALQQTARDHAPVTALAVDRDGSIPLKLRQGRLEAVQRIPVHAVDVASLPFTFSTDIQHLQPAALQPRAEFLHRNLLQLREGESRSLPTV